MIMIKQDMTFQLCYDPIEFKLDLFKPQTFLYLFLSLFLMEKETKLMQDANSIAYYFK